ncbi:hypothetical protein [Agromyces bauzanensis]|uniref:Uncharacterized protein n=1 Tax=Agromyces bauzanensis TaxID=1308924 RepID=A0A917UU90_9MICO|nr:hypothetical protein [Agromyces bauzanensis]GGJ85536.1 hypothetical protein GCM10011372_24800 [Agromyces bauzanensis]
MIQSTAAAVGGVVPLAAYLIAWSLARNIAWRAYRRALWWVTAPAIIGAVASDAGVVPTESVTTTADRAAPPRP